MGSEAAFMPPRCRSVAMVSIPDSLRAGMRYFPNPMFLVGPSVHIVKSTSSLSPRGCSLILTIFSNRISLPPRRNSSSLIGSGQIGHLSPAYRNRDVATLDSRPSPPCRRLFESVSSPIINSARSGEVCSHRHPLSGSNGCPRSFCLPPVAVCRFPTISRSLYAVAASRSLFPVAVACRYFLSLFPVAVACHCRCRCKSTVCLTCLSRLVV